MTSFLGWKGEKERGLDGEPTLTYLYNLFVEPNLTYLYNPHDFSMNSVYAQKGQFYLLIVT